jgi:hypothetical protein
MKATPVTIVVQSRIFCLRNDFLHATLSVDYGSHLNLKAVEQVPAQSLSVIATCYLKKPIC